ncbi:MAG: hypothetical protein H6610_04350 [Ignavibacteriales bacterium]|nr:hypothetical protein [Ignavibacteriales bacterium]
MKNIIWSICFLLLISNISFSQTIIGKISDPTLGFTLEIPNEWKGEKANQGYVFISESYSGFILIAQHNFNTFEEIVENAKQGISEENGTFLSLDGELIKSNDKRVGGLFAGYLEGQPVKSYAESLLSPFGGGLSIFVFVEVENFSEYYKDLIKNISESVMFSKPLENSFSNEIKQVLSNCRLTHINTYNSGYGSGGIQDKIIIDLCETGNFNYYDESQVSISGGDLSGFNSGEKSGSGNWDILKLNNQTILKLNFYSGEFFEYVLTFENDKTFLNGKRYFRTYKNSDVEGTLPNCP